MYSLCIQKKYENWQSNRQIFFIAFEFKISVTFQILFIYIERERF